MSEPPPAARPRGLRRRRRAGGARRRPGPLVARGPLVLKPLDWLPARDSPTRPTSSRRSATDGFRVASPLPEAVDGWTAAPYLEGVTSRAAGARSSPSARASTQRSPQVPRPDAIARRTRRTRGRPATASPGRADPTPVSTTCSPRSSRWTGRGSSMHGDLTGNVLFHPTLPPAIIDFAPYWRPTEYAIGDRRHATRSAGRTHPPSSPTPSHPQLLLRAAIFRG